MIAADTNLLVYSHRIDSPWHDAARECMRSLAEGREPWAIPWPCLHEFYAVVTHPQIYRPPSTTREAVAQIEAWMTSPRLEILAENDGYWHELRGLVDRGRVVGPFVHDARVAALCLLHGVRELWSADRDFGRFPGLHVRNPLP